MGKPTIEPIDLACVDSETNRITLASFCDAPESGVARFLEAEALWNALQIGRSPVSLVAGTRLLGQPTPYIGARITFGDFLEVGAQAGPDFIATSLALRLAELPP